MEYWRFILKSKQLIFAFFEAHVSVLTNSFRTYYSLLQQLTWWCHPSSIINHIQTEKKRCPKKTSSRTLPPVDYSAELLLYYLFISKSIYSYSKKKEKIENKKNRVSYPHLSGSTDWWWMIDDWWWMKSHQWYNTSSSASQSWRFAFFLLYPSQFSISC